MTKKQQDRIIKYYKSCTLYDTISYKNENFNTFKDAFFNAVMGRVQLGYTQNDVANLLKVSLRNVIELEKGKSNNLKIVLNYISAFKHDFALEARRKSFLRNYKFISCKAYR